MNKNGIFHKVSRKKLINLKNYKKLLHLEEGKTLHTGKKWMQINANEYKWMEMKANECKWMQMNEIECKLMQMKAN